MSNLATLPVLVGFVLAATACSSFPGSSGNATGGDGGGAASGPSCSLAPASEVQADLGLSGVQAPVSTTLDPVTECNYSTSGAGIVLIRFETGETMATFQEGEQGFSGHGLSASPVTGIGDAAYSSTLGTGSSAINTLVVLKGSIEVEISASASLADLQVLASHIIAAY